MKLFHLCSCLLAQALHAGSLHSPAFHDHSASHSCEPLSSDPTDLSLSSYRIASNIKISFGGTCPKLWTGFVHGLRAGRLPVLQALKHTMLQKTMHGEGVALSGPKVSRLKKESLVGLQSYRAIISIYK